MQITKRDGRVVQWDRSKIERAIQKAGGPPHIASDVETHYHDGITVEEVQDIVEATLMGHGYYDVAKRYVLYREEHRKLRGVVVPNDAIERYIRTAKYAQKVGSRRETWDETVDRTCGMHCERFPKYESRIRYVFDEFVRPGHVIPSARSLQFAGARIKRHEAAIYNCSASATDRIRFFAEEMYLLLCGCGVGTSVQRCHVDRMPELTKVGRKVKHFSIPDTIEGWAEAVYELLQGHVMGWYVEFDYSGIRPEGAPLRTSGGYAPGHLGLRQSLETARDILDRVRDRKLKPIECMDLSCIFADAVLSGGVRRSSRWVGFDSDDSEMMTCKTGDWMETHPWRKNANISAYLFKDTPRSVFKRIIAAAKEYGDPGFYFAADRNFIPNPCVEIGMFPFFYGDSGFSFCNLVEQVMKGVQHEYAKRMAEAASFIGTLQATYTNFRYLSSASKSIAERDALLGVSMTGMMDCDFAFDPDFQREMVSIVNEANKFWAEKLGIRPAARTTCVKPSGTLSLAFGCSSGVHPHEAKRIFRRVIANHTEGPFKLLQKANPHACVQKSDTEWVISFPVETSGITWDEITDIEFLEKVRSTYLNYVKPGGSADGLTHNVSCTVKVRDWDAVEEYLWDYREELAAVSLIDDYGLIRHPHVPRQRVTEADWSEWTVLCSKWKAVDYQQEIDDVIDVGVACDGDKCASI